MQEKSELRATRSARMCSMHSSLAQNSAPPCFGPPPGLAQVPSMPLSSLPSTALASTPPTAQTYPREWRPLGAKPKSLSATSPPGYDQSGTGSGGDGALNPAGGAPSGSRGPGSNPAGGGVLAGGGPPGGNPPNGSQRIPPPPPPRTPPQQTAGPPGGTPGTPSSPPVRQHAQRAFELPSNYMTRSILETQQMLEDWLNKSTFATAAWRGDAQFYWLDQVLEIAEDEWEEQQTLEKNSCNVHYGHAKSIPDPAELDSRRAF